MSLAVSVPALAPFLSLMRARDKTLSALRHRLECSEPRSCTQAMQYFVLQVVATRGYRKMRYIQKNMSYSLKYCKNLVEMKQDGPGDTTIP